MSAIAVVIPTYKRAHLLALLLDDLQHQTRQPCEVIVVDGDPESGDVLRMMQDRDYPESWSVCYVPSNHGNLSYQRYLGWKAVRGANVLVYLDDDMRIEQRDALERLVQPLDTQPDVVGLTGIITFGDASALEETKALNEPSGTSNSLIQTVRRVAGNRRPGTVTPLGHRIPPTMNGDDYVPVEWLRGGVMAFRLPALSQECFSDDLFALYHIRRGRGEDTFLSRRVGAKGRMLLATRAVFLHPNVDLPKAYPYQAQKLAHAVAYSRRFLNDHYRPFQSPTALDRLHLYLSYGYNVALHWLRAIRVPERYRAAYAWGYMRGAVRGLLQRPTARHLTPDVNWWADADAALDHAVHVRSE